MMASAGTSASLRLAVFTNEFPGRVSTFFARDIRGLLAAGAEVDVFAIRPRDETLWRFVPSILGEAVFPRDRVHHLGLGESLLAGPGILRSHSRRATADAWRILGASGAGGVETLAKSSYVLPKAWTWASRFAGRFDHVLSYWGNYAATCAYAFHRLTAPATPFSMFLHAGTDLYRSRVFMREKLRHARHVITVCDFNRRYLLECYPDLRDELEPKVHVHHLGLDFAELNLTVASRVAGRVLGVGSLLPLKGFDGLLRAGAMLVKRGFDIQIELVGEGSEELKLRRLSKELGLETRVTFSGWLPFVRVKERMQAATLLVHPSSGLGDAVPTVIKEAMALGTPVVAADVAGIPELLDSGRCGLLVPPRDAPALAEAIGRVLGDAELRESLSVAARARAEAMFDLWKNGQALARILAA